VATAIDPRLVQPRDFEAPEERLSFHFCNKMSRGWKRYTTDRFPSRALESDNNHADLVARHQPHEANTEFGLIVILEADLLAQNFKGVHGRSAQMPVRFCQTLVFHGESAPNRLLSDRIAEMRKSIWIRIMTGYGTWAAINICFRG
jgi:hypothetical protein